MSREAMKRIKTWNERCEEHPDHQTGMISQRMIQERMQEEIDELRQALETEQKTAVSSGIVGTQDEEGRYGAIESEANARLIAAAPDLLKALKWLAVCVKRPGPHMDAVAALEKADAAIAKATGEA